jgi:copper(I)-binding protein
MAMLHQSQNVNGVMKMTGVDSVSVPAHGTVAFAPGSYHVMLMGGKKTPVIGSSVGLGLSFKDSGKLSSTCAVKGPDAAGPN